MPVVVAGQRTLVSLKPSRTQNSRPLWAPVFYPRSAPESTVDQLLLLPPLPRLHPVPRCYGRALPNSQHVGAAHPPLAPVRDQGPLSPRTTSPPSLTFFWQPFEHRAALTPTTAKKLMDAGFKVTVEKDPQRIFDDAEYSKCVSPPLSPPIDTDSGTVPLSQGRLPVGGTQLVAVGAQRRSDPRPQRAPAERRLPPPAHPHPIRALLQGPIRLARRALPLPPRRRDVVRLGVPAGR